MTRCQYMSGVFKAQEIHLKVVSVWLVKHWAAWPRKSVERESEIGSSREP